MDFSQLKKGSSVDDLNKKVERFSKNYQKDADRFWNITSDKTGNGMAVIRFLPVPPMDTDSDALEWATVFRHSFEDVGGWFIEECPTTIGEPCFCCESNKEAWATGNEDLRKIAQARKRQLKYISNIYIVSDPGNPENNGKVKLYKYGAKIFNKIQSAMKPEFADEVAFDPFNLWTGANFVVKKTGSGRDTNYDKSAFQSPGPLFEDEGKMEEVWKQEQSLKAFYDPSIFSTYDAIKKRFERVTGKATYQASNESPGGYDVPDDVKGFEGYDSEPQSQEELGDMEFFKYLAKDDVPF